MISVITALTIVSGVVIVNVLVVMTIWSVVRTALVNIVRDGIVASRDYSGSAARTDRNNPTVLTESEVRALKARRAARINSEGK